jgi:hypothetical protein
VTKGNKLDISSETLATTGQLTLERTQFASGVSINSDIALITRFLREVRACFRAIRQAPK